MRSSLLAASVALALTVVGVPCAKTSTAAEPLVDALVVTEARTARPGARALGAISIIPEEEIRATLAAGAAELLRHRPGLHLDQPGARGSRASVYTRGLDPNHTLVLLDGIPLNDPTNARGGSFDLATLATDSISQVEIARGPLSAVHGSDALAGAVHIRTRDGKGPDRLSLRLSGGRWGHFRAVASGGAERGPVDVSVTGSYVDEGVPSSIGSYRAASLHTKVGLALPGGGDLRGTLRFVDSRNEAFPEFSGGFEFAELRAFERRDVRELAVGLFLRQPITERLEAALRFTTNQRWEDRRHPGVPPQNPSEPGTDDRYERYSLTAQATARFGYGFAFTGGGDVYWEDGTSEGDIAFGENVVPDGADFEIERVVGAPFIEAVWDSDFGLSVLAGLRSDLPEDRSAEFTPRVTATWSLPSPHEQVAVDLHGGWGEGFKLPSFYALANPLAGNRDLVPERSEGWDVGTTWTLSGDLARLHVGYFDIDVENLIDFSLSSFRLENIEDTRSRGVEVELFVRPLGDRADVEFRAHATWNEATNLSDDLPLRNRPRWRGGFALLWQPIPNVRARIEGLFVGKVADASIPTGDDEVLRLPDYQRFDAALSWAPLDWLEVFVAIDNLSDQKYEEAVGFRHPGIRPRAGIEVRL